MTYYSEIVQDFENALEDKEYCDIIIKVGENPDVKELQAHSFVLRARCPYFKRALSNDWEEKDDDGNFIFKKPNISPEVFQLILRYLYTGIVDYDQNSKDIILQVLVAADELGLDKLIGHMQEYLIKDVHKDPISTLQIIYQHEPFESLRERCLDIISEEPKILFSSQKFPLLEKPIITMVLQRDDLNMKEIDIWDSLLRWLFVHYLKIGEDNSTWSSEDLTNVKQTIKEHIPLIRFYDITREDFYLKVYPYKDLLPQDLLNDILRCHMIPNSTPVFNLKPSRCRRVNSDLINYNVFELFAKWIDEKDDDYTRQNMPYKFELLLRGTRDGFDSAKFHQLCDNMGSTIVLGRIKDSNRIVGGYNPLNWHQNSSYSNANKSFLFNIDGIQNLKSAKVGRIISGSEIIYGHCNYGPTFGKGHDLRVDKQNWSSNGGKTFSNINIPSNFTVDEYEIFKVVVKSD